MNARLIADEGHRNRLTAAELEKRMGDWLAGNYQAVLFELADVPAAYALFRPTEDGVYPRQFFVEREHRRKGVGQRAIEILWREVLTATRH